MDSSDPFCQYDHPKADRQLQMTCRTTQGFPQKCSALRRYACGKNTDSFTKKLSDSLGENAFLLCTRPKFPSSFLPILPSSSIPVNLQLDSRLNVKIRFKVRGLGGVSLQRPRARQDETNCVQTDPTSTQLPDYDPDHNSTVRTTLVITLGCWRQLLVHGTFYARPLVTSRAYIR